MPITNKKRYARATRFRKIMSPNLSLQQTRRYPIQIIAASLSTPDAVLTVDRPFILASDGLTNTGIRTQGGVAPTGITINSASQFTLHFPAMTTITEVEIPFEDPWVRGQTGEYLQNGAFQSSD